jgi:hypothetical protein
VLAGGIDWTLAGVLYLLALIPLGLVQGIGLEIDGLAGLTVFALAQATALGVLVSYFAYFFRTGHTLGMRALDIHMFEYESGGNPGLARSLGRTFVSLVLATACLNAYSYVQGEPYFGEFTAFENAVGTIATGLSTGGLLGHLWQLADAEGRTLWDRLSGLVVIEDIVPASAPDRLWSPWGT